MRRRKVITTGAAAGLTVIAGCFGLGDDDSAAPDDGGATTTPEPTSETPEEPDEEEVTYSVEPSTDEIDWGETFTVTVTAKAGDDPPIAQTGILYQAPDDTTWSGGFDGSSTSWRLDGGETKTQTYELEPPGVGEFRLGFADARTQEVYKEWDLTVNPPVQSFGESLSYYDGLDMTLDVEFHEWLEFELYWWYDPVKSGMYSVRPREGQWVKVWVTGENTNTNQEVSPPEAEKFSGLEGNSQLKHHDGKTRVWKDTDYEVDDPSSDWDVTEGEKIPSMHIGYDGDFPEGYWNPPDPLISGAAFEGWLLFEAGPDTTAEDIEIRLKRNNIRATWE